MNKYQEAWERFSNNLYKPNEGYDIFERGDDELLIDELVEKATPKKPIDIQEPLVKWGICPTCKGLLNTLGGRPNRVLESDRYCRDCGQALDWSEEDDC